MGWAIHERRSVSADENLCHDPCAVAAAKFGALDQVRAIISLPKELTRFMISTLQIISFFKADFKKGAHKK